MTAIQIFYPEGNTAPQIPNTLMSKFPDISCDPQVHDGWPHIKGTRILATDILRGQIQGYSPETMLMEFNQMGIKVTKTQLLEAQNFTIAWLYQLNEKKASKATR